MAFALADALASGALRLPGTLWGAELLLGLTFAGLAWLLTMAARRPAHGGGAVLALAAALQGAALASKGLAGGERLAGFALAAAAGLVVLATPQRGGAWLGALLLPLGAGLPLFPSPWFALAWGLLAAAAPLAPRRARSWLALFGLAALLALHPQRPGLEPRVTRAPVNTPPARGPNVVLLVIDTLRADELPVGGNLERFARAGLDFTQCTSTAPWTLPSVSSLLTSLHPSQHGAVNAATPLPLELETLAEHFAAAGYRTGAFTGGAFVGPGHHLDQGFEH
ncbi:MAG: sulfatase-like hydrolase/transferase, partial [Planctomycetota bacterium]